MNKTLHCPACSTLISQDCLIKQISNPLYPSKSAMLKCSCCGHSYFESLPDAGLYSDRESSNYNSNSFAFAVKQYYFSLFCKRLFERILPQNNNFRSVLDFGCGSGEFANSIQAYLSKRKNRVSGPSDIATVACDLQPERPSSLNRKVHYFEIAQMPEDLVFDVIVIRHVLEHIKDLAQVIGLLHRRLEKGGLLVIEVPNGRSPFRLLLGSLWPGYFYPFHYHIFTSQSICRLLAENGFTVIRKKDANPPIFGVLANYYLRNTGACKAISLLMFPFQYVVGRLFLNSEAILIVCTSQLR